MWNFLKKKSQTGKQNKMLNADHFYCIGSSHHFCEDFADSATHENKSYAIVSDGCSSATDSMIGSMLLTKSASQNIYPIRSSEQSQVMVDLTIQMAGIFQRTLGVSQEALNATLLTVAATPNSFRVTTTGDGVIVARNKEGWLEFHELEYTTNAPFYPAYSLTPTSVKQYLEEFPGEYVMRSTINGVTEEHRLPMEVGRLAGVITYCYDFSFNQYDLVGVLSDGVQSFYKEVQSDVSKTRQSVPTKEVIEELFAFKNFKGEFVKRRLQKAFKLFKRNNWDHFDDFSMGVVYNA